MADNVRIREITVMSTFTALNIEPESDSEDEIDNSKEIQIEEALKLYQNALKLHSLGPRFYDEAEKAYNALFHSEVFTYLESLSESQRVEYYGEAAEEFISSHEPPATEPVLVAASADGAPSTLPQILYLSYKNHGHFILDSIKWRLHQASKQDAGQPAIAKEPESFSEEIASSLRFLVEALDRDETDIELWRQLSEIGKSLGSTRIARFCLEAVLDREEVAGDAWPEPLGLQELFAAESLRKLLHRLQDDLGESTLPRLTPKQQDVVQSFSNHIHPLPYLPTPPPDTSRATTVDQGFQGRTTLQEIVVPLRNWASCGKAILFQLQQEAQGFAELKPGACYTLVLPTSHLGVETNLSEVKTIPERGNDSEAERIINTKKSRIKTDGNEPPDQRNDVAQDEQASPQGLGIVPTPPRVSEPVEVSANSGVAAQNTDTFDHNLGSAQANRGSVDPQGSDNRTIILPTRKRSNDAAEIEEAEDSVRSRSKRIKARTSIDEPTSGREARARQQLELYQEGELQYFNILDERAFGQLEDTLAALGVATVESVRERRANVISIAKALKDSIGESTIRTTKDEKTLMRDLTTLLSTLDSETSNLFLHGGGFEDPISGAGVARNPGLLTFLEQSGAQARERTSLPILTGDRGLNAFVDVVRKEHMHIDQLALAWVTALLAPNGIQQDANGTSTLTAYEAFLWPDTLKETVVQMLVKHDEFLFLILSDDLASSIGHRTSFSNGMSRSTCSHAKMVHNIFELHLDIYGRITNPSSEVDVPTRTAQLDRLQRWASLAYQVCKSSTDLESDVGVYESWHIRFLWAYTVLAELCGICSQDIVVMYFEDLKFTLEQLGSPVVELRNNAVMPEVSIEAAEKQISRLTTMDFFSGIFSPINDDPVALIESLEPILEKSMQKDRLHQGALKEDATDTASHVENALDACQGDAAIQHNNSMRTEHMRQFLDKASLSMQLMLWRRLIDAYSIIQYTPRILWCYLRCIALIVSHLQSSQYSDNDEQDRPKLLLRWLKSLDDLLAWTLALAWSDPQSLDCMDEANLQDALSTLTTLQCMLHPVMVMDDLFTIGLCEPPNQINNPVNTAYYNSLVRLREMMVRTWTIRYILIREGAAQTSSISSITHGDLFEILTSIHRCLGPRKYCKLADKVFLKLARRELSRLGNSADSEVEAAQIILDMYGLKICPGSKELEDHECPSETLHRSDALDIMDRVLIQVNRLSTKDLIKSDLRLAVEKIQQAIRVPRVTASVLHNRRVFSEFLRRPINPRDLYRALQGVGELHFQQPHGESFRIAEKGWYFLQGQVALTKYRSQKRVSIGASDELDVALKFFEYDLEQGYEKWETWYRLAQVYDAKIEEETTWTAEKLNNHMEDLVKLQRSAIHCYTMAVATVERCLEPTFVMFQTVADLYFDFGIRIYGSSREPFAMEALSAKDFTKHFNAGRLGTWQGEPFKAITLYGAWTFASRLLRRALAHKLDNWMYVFAHA